MHDTSKISYGSNVELVDKFDTGSLYRMTGCTGEGTMRMFHVFPGIDLIYNDFHMASCLSEFQSQIPLIGIDHCQEGRIEWELENGRYLYLQEGDLQISGKRNHAKTFGFPLAHYHGITIALRMEDMDADTAHLLEHFAIDPNRLYHHLCLQTDPCVRKTDEAVSNIFSVLYAIQDRPSIPLQKLKILELLLLLNTLDNTREARSYFPKKQVDIIKEIAALITGHLEQHYTIRQLSALFDIRPTTMKLCFKGVYGAPIGQYLRNYRMTAAAKLLRDGSHSIAVIAGKVGYDNQSKFAAAFKAIQGVTPSEYQKLSAFSHRLLPHPVKSALLT